MNTRWWKLEYDVPYGNMLRWAYSDCLQVTGSPDCLSESCVLSLSGVRMQPKTWATQVIAHCHELQVMGGRCSIGEERPKHTAASCLNWHEAVTACSVSLSCMLKDAWRASAQVPTLNPPAAEYMLQFGR